MTITVTKPIASFLILFILTGCSNFTGNGETRFYTLSALAPSQQQSFSQPRQLRLGIGPIKLPRLLKHPQIITRKNQHEILMAEQHQWGGSLKEDITQVVADNLGHLLVTKQIENFPWKRHFKPDYQVRIKIQRFDGELGDTAVLEARWWLRVGNAPNDQLAERFLLTDRVTGNNYASYVAALNRLLLSLSEEIARSISFEEQKA